MAARSHRKTPRLPRGSPLLATLAVALLAACTVRLAPDYDPVRDRSVSELATRIDAFLARIAFVVRW